MYSLLIAALHRSTDAMPSAEVSRELQPVEELHGFHQRQLEGLCGGMIGAGSTAATRYDTSSDRANSSASLTSRMTETSVEGGHHADPNDSARFPHYSTVTLFARLRG